MTRLKELYERGGQSPWLDNLPRSYLIDGTLSRYIEQGIRGVTANPTILAKAIGTSDVYDEQFQDLISSAVAISDAYWTLVLDDAREALRLLRPLFDESAGTDGFVSIEVSPELAHDSAATLEATRALHKSLRAPNLLVKIPATSPGIDAIRAATAEGYNVNVTLIFSLGRYREVIEAYVTGLEEFARAGGDAAKVHSVASFFVSRVDTEVDERLANLGTEKALALRGHAAVAQAKLAYQLFVDRFSDPAWASLSACGAHVQRPLWASTSTKNPRYSPVLYVDELIGPDTVNTLPETTIAVFEEQGTVAPSLDRGVDAARAVLAQLDELGVNMQDVGSTLEEQGVSSFEKSFADVLSTLDAKFKQVAEP